MRHILVKTKAQADSIYNQLKAGADFAALAKKYSQDPGSKDNGGKLTIIRGQTVAPFDTTAFLLSTNTISRPVKTQYGYHVIQPISAIKPAEDDPVEGREAGDRGDAPRQGEDRRDHEVDERRQELLRQEGQLRDRVRPAGSRDGHDGGDHRLIRVGRGRGQARHRRGALAEALVDLQELTKRLRRDCPWDREQTARTIVPHTVEEAYEVAEAAYADDPAKLLDELGDLLFQTYFLALLLEEQGARRSRDRRPRRAREARAPAPARLRRRGGRLRRPGA